MRDGIRKYVSEARERLDAIRGYVDVIDRNLDTIGMYNCEPIMPEWPDHYGFMKATAEKAAGTATETAGEVRRLMGDLEQIAVAADMGCPTPEDSPQLFPGGKT